LDQLGSSRHTKSQYDQKLFVGYSIYKLDSIKARETWIMATSSKFIYTSNPVLNIPHNL